MKINEKWLRLVRTLGLIAFFLGTLDPLEGSVFIAAGTLLLAFSAYQTQDRNWKVYLRAFGLIVFGVFFMFYFSSLGGFGGTSSLSWWWGLLILPYPVGWLTVIILLILRKIKRKSR